MAFSVSMVLDLGRAPTFKGGVSWASAPRKTESILQNTLGKMRGTWTAKNPVHHFWKLDNVVYLYCTFSYTVPVIYLYSTCTCTCTIPLPVMYLNQPCPGPPLCGWPPVCTWWTWPCQTSSCVSQPSLSPLSLPLRWATKGHREELVRHRKELVRHMTQLVRHRTQLVRHMTKIIKHTS